MTSGDSVPLPPCDPMTSSLHPMRPHCMPFKASARGAPDTPPSSSREQSGTLATPSNYPYSKTSQSKLAASADEHKAPE
jgi:hypothetical protein